MLLALIAVLCLQQPAPRLGSIVQTHETKYGHFRRDFGGIVYVYHRDVVWSDGDRFTIGEPCAMTLFYGRLIHLRQSKTCVSHLTDYEIKMGAQPYRPPRK
ncbi:MAG: hypothetical protein UX60_C0008G0006 [Berkelbacteria bacterium GW2011_GWA2_46_7]|uniref:Uncharacterized protein n=1 Tax=Berkelbacteria bacterium GW2011_GWA2_46_7 TaxID=1618335 RepID=A0A0G1QHL5_9BACT|nr:MAG: hypothetical protein UX60_C0008G0006 [Berkelbacteria bacterium GW2011_GWA2_46_7]